ncbi:hypothetical protein [Nitrogeniibacter aestuarii]|uniref:hypothetical protein n=1 Tax=Nitrogeniibacter aestuarii TaxID=2815343 RepID=UPI001E4AA24E|nr:hypothetical protein [Nitrogeniibacter aestuarii]
MSVTELRSRKSRRRYAVKALIVCAGCVLVLVLMLFVGVQFSGTSSGLTAFRDQLAEFWPIASAIKLAVIFLIWWFWVPVVTHVSSSRGVCPEMQDEILRYRNRIAGFLLAVEFAFMIPRIMGGT